MIPLYHPPHYTFQFAEDRLIDRFHLEGLAAGTPVRLYRWTPTDQLGTPLANATVGADGWVDLAEPLIVQARDGFIAVPG